MGRNKKERSTNDQQRADIFNKYITPNVKLVYSVVSTCTTNKSNIDDNYQECLMMILNYCDTYDERKSLRNWIITIVKRYVGKLEAKRGQLYHQSDDEDGTVDDDHGNKWSASYIEKYSPKSKMDFRLIDNDELFYVEPTTFLDLGAHDEVILAIEKMDKINPKVARAFLMRHIWNGEGMGLSEIATMEGVTKTVAKMRVYQGKLLLKKILEENKVKINEQQ